MNVCENLHDALAEAIRAGVITDRLLAAHERHGAPELGDVAEPPSARREEVGPEPPFDSSAFGIREIGGFRRGDPETSRAAAIEHYRSSAVMRTSLFLAIARAPRGLTSAEACELLDLPHETVSPRFAELRDRGCIRDTDEKRRLDRPGKRSQIVRVARPEALAYAVERGWIGPQLRLAG